jgi:hypothetical protein
LEVIDQLRSESFFLRQHWRQFLRKTAYVTSQHNFTLRVEGVGDRHPLLYDGSASLDKSWSSGISVCLGLVQFLRYLFNGRYQRPRLSMPLRAETSVAGLVAISAAGNARSGVRGDPLLSHHPREILPPLAQHCFVHMESLAVISFRLYHHMHVRMLLIGVQCHRIAVLESEVFQGKPPSAGKDLVRRRW